MSPSRGGPLEMVFDVAGAPAYTGVGFTRRLGDGPGLYEPVHGSAPDIAGKGLANPLAAIGSVAMMFRFSFQLEGIANQIEKSIQRVLAEGYRSADIYSDGMIQASTSEIGDKVIEYFVS